MAAIPWYNHHRYTRMRDIPNARRAWIRYTIAWEFMMSGFLLLCVLLIVQRTVLSDVLVWVLFTGLCLYMLCGTISLMMTAMPLQAVIQRHKQLQRSLQ